MPELRYDPFKKKWVIIAGDRGARPHQFIREPDPGKAGDPCPFCSGNESMTPAETFALRQAGTAPDTPGWSVRVVPNKFPALSPETSPLPMISGLFANTPGFGTHEVIIESTDHALQMADQLPEKVAAILQVYRRRISDLSCDERMRAVLVFKNHGPEAGASLSHPHTQLAALSFVPDVLEAEMLAFEDYHQEVGKCLMCEVVESEVTDGDRVISVDRGFVVFTPYASSFPYEMWIAPEKHDRYFKSITDDGCYQLAHVLCSVFGRLKDKLGDPPFNMVLHTAPAGVERFHWHLEITPRLSKPGGFELGSGVMINSVSPEEAAKFLR